METSYTITKINAYKLAILSLEKPLLTADPNDSEAMENVVQELFARYAELHATSRLLIAEVEDLLKHKSLGVENECDFIQSPNIRAIA